MDPLSHAALGAAIAHGGFHRRLGWRAATWGALAAMAPDLDELWSFRGDAFDALVSHRGITHSLLFVPFVGIAWGWLMHRRNGRRDLGVWIGVIVAAMLSHPLLDYLTPYGTQLFAPVSNARFAANTMPIIDPLYTLILIAGLVVAWRWRAEPRSAHASLAALALSCGYLGFAAYLNTAAQQFAERQLAAQQVEQATVTAYPTLLQVFLRRIVARTPHEDRVGYVNAWRPCPIQWGVAPRLRSSSIDAVLESREGKIFDWFSAGQLATTLVPTTGGVHIHLADLRYGIDLDPGFSIFAIGADIDTRGALVAAPRMMPQWLSMSDRRVGAVLEGASRGYCE